MSGPRMKETVTVPRAWLEQLIQTGIDLLDAADAGATDREPEADEEITSEDDATVTDWRDTVGRQFGS